jgi:DegV family protein with EDD domain
VTISIVTDSATDIPEEVAATLRIQVVPAILVIDGRNSEDGKDLSRKEFYEQLPAMKTPPTTSSPSAGSFQQVYEGLFSRGADQIISVHVAGALSSIFNTAQLAAQSFGDRVRVVDTGTVTLAAGFQVIAAAEAALSGYPLERVLQSIASIRPRIHLVALLDSLEYVRRSGRVSWARSSLGTLLQIKPFLSVSDGKVIRLGEARTRKKGILRLTEMLTDLGQLERLAILHSNAESDALQLKTQYSSQSAAPPLVVNVTTVIGTHVGPNGLGYVAVTKQSQS